MGQDSSRTGWQSSRRKMLARGREWCEGDERGTMAGMIAASNV
jgi:hypothetical protein